MSHTRRTFATASDFVTVYGSAVLSKPAAEKSVARRRYSSLGLGLATLGLLVACEAEKPPIVDELGGSETGAVNATTSSPTGTLSPTGNTASEGVSPQENPTTEDQGGFISAPPMQTMAEIPEDAGKVETVVKADCAATEVSAVDTTVLVPADIIIAVDTSSSMQVETIFVQQQLNQFSRQIIDSGVDARVILIALAGEGETLEPGDAGAGGGMMGGMGGMGGFGGRDFTICIDAPLGSGACPDDQLLPNYIHIDQLVDSRDALTQIVNTFPQYREHLRPNSAKAFLVVTDDESDVSAADFTANITQLNTDTGLFERWTMNSVYAFSTTDCDDETGVALGQNVGNVYKELVTQTSGVQGDLCLQDFQPVFDALATQIVENAGAEIVCEWEIPASVEGQTFSTDLVEVSRTSGDVVTPLQRVANAQACASGGWYFDDAYSPQSIIACESTCAEMQGAEGRIDVAFGCEIVEGCAASEAADLTGAPAPASTEGSTQASSDTAGAAPIAVACEWPLPETGSTNQQLDLENVNVRYTTGRGFGVLLGNVADMAACASADLGWYYDNPEEPTKIVACPGTCDVLNSRQITEVQALFGCETKPAKPMVTL
jgi:hypothetical protein